MCLRKWGWSFGLHQVGPLMCYDFLLCFQWRTWSTAWCVLSVCSGLVQPLFFKMFFFGC